ncbi:MAG: hypothetical protein ACE5GE_02770 [Phycisphaerae bacterium]
MDQTADPKASIAVRVTQSREHRRRIRIVRRAVLLGAMGLLICFAAVSLRNYAYIRQNTTRFEKATAGLVATYRDTGTLPVFYPPHDPMGLPERADDLHYQDSAVIRHLRQSPEGGVVAYSETVRQILRPDRRIVLMLRSGQLTIETMPLLEFRSHQEALRSRAAQNAQKPPVPAQALP